MLRVLVLVAAALGGAAVLTGSARPTGRLGLSRDGLIVFASNRAENLEAPEIFSVTLAGGRRNLTRTPKEIEYGARVSPDREWVLFRRGYEGDADIYAARPDGRDARKLAFGSSPAWSPDGQRIAYDVGFPRTIHVVPLAGGEATPLTQGLLAAWSPDATKIAFVDSATGLRFFVVAADGTGRRALAPELRYGGVLTYPPQWSPDGRRILLPTAGPSDEPTVTLVELASGRVESLAPGSHAKWSPDGRLIVFEERARRYGLGVLDPATGELRHVAGAAEAEEAPVWSPSGREIAFFRDRQLWVVRPDGSGLRQVTREPSTSLFFQYDEPAFVDEGTVLFSSLLDGNDFDLYSMRPDGTRLRRLTETPASETEPAWSPDGRQILFVRQPLGCDGVHGFAGCGLLYAINADGSGVRRLSGRDTQPVSSPTWAPDGRSIAFVGRQRDDLAVYVARPDGRGLRRVPGTSLSAVDVDWAPRGDQLAYTRTGDVFTVPSSGGVETRITSGFFASSAPAWAPDGRRLAVVRTYSCGDECERHELVLKPIGEPARRVAAAATEPAWSPDGSTIAFHDDATRRIGLARADGSSRRLVTSGPGEDRDPDWTPARR